MCICLQAKVGQWRSLGGLATAMRPGTTGNGSFEHFSPQAADEVAPRPLVGFVLMILM